jgi:hypothetical protein
MEEEYPKLSLDLDPDEQREVIFLTQEAGKLLKNEKVDLLQEKFKLVVTNEELIHQAVVAEACNQDEFLNTNIGYINALGDLLEDGFHQAKENPSFDRDSLKRQIIETYPDVLTLIDNTQRNIHGQDQVKASRRLDRWVQRFDKSEKGIEELVTDIRNPEVGWHYLVSQNVISPEISGQMDNLLLLFEAHNKMQIIGDSDLEKKQKQALIAQIGLEMHEKGLSASIFTNAIRDPESFGPNFLGEVAGAFLNIEEETEKLSGRVSNITLAKVIISTSIIGTMLLSSDSRRPDPVIEKAKDPDKSFGVKGFRNMSDDLHSRINIPNITNNGGNISVIQTNNGQTTDSGNAASQGLNGNLSGEDSENAAGQNLGSSDRNEGATSKNENNKIHPQNGSLKENDFTSPVTVWELDGNPPSGYYKTGSSKYWNVWDRSWELTREELETQQVEEFNQNHKSEFTGQTEIQSEFGSEEIDLAVPQGYGPVADSIRVFQGEDEINSDNLELILYADGSYGFRVKNITKQGILKVSIGFEKSKDNISTNFSEEWNNDSLGFSSEDMPEDVQQIYKQAESMKKNGATNEEVSKLLADWIKNNFTYSLNPVYSDYYDSAQYSNTYWQRIFSKRHADCDVANTALLSMLRELGINSHLAVGYGNWADGKVSKITGKEAHGWAEIYDDKTGKALIVDATPTKQDEFTKNTKGEGNPLGSPLRIGDAIKQELLKQQLFFQSLKNGEIYGGSGTLWNELFYGLIQTSLSLWAMKNKSQYKKAVDQFEASLGIKLKGKKSDSYYAMRSLLEQDLAPLRKSGGLGHKLVNVVGGALVVPRSLNRIEEGKKIRRIKKGAQDLAGGKMEKADGLEILANIAGTTIEKVSKKIEARNKFYLLQDISGTLNTRLMESLFGKTHDVDQILIDWRRAYDGAKTLDQFYLKAAHQIYFKEVTRGFPVSHIYEKSKELGGFNGFQSKLSDDFKKAIAVYWLVAKSGNSANLTKKFIKEGKN